VTLTTTRPVLILILLLWNHFLNPMMSTFPSCVKEREEQELHITIIYVDHYHCIHIHNKPAKAWWSLTEHCFENEWMQGISLTTHSKRSHISQSPNFGGKNALQGWETYINQKTGKSSEPVFCQLYSCIILEQTCSQLIKALEIENAKFRYWKTISKGRNKNA
jgi:hypothetical protein